MWGFCGAVGRRRGLEVAVATWGRGGRKRRGISHTCGGERTYLADFYSPASASLTDPPPPRRHFASWRFQYWVTWTLSELLPVQLDSHPVFASILQRPRRWQRDMWEANRARGWSGMPRFYPSILRDKKRPHSRPGALNSDIPTVICCLIEDVLVSM